MMDQRAESESVGPRAAEIGDFDVLVDSVKHRLM